MSAGRGRLRGALVAAQVAGSLVLLIVAGLFTQSLERAQRVDLGFDATQILNLSMDPHQAGYSEAQGRQFYRRLLARARALPGVESAALAFTVPMRFYTMNSDYLSIDDYTPPPGRPKPVVGFNDVSPGYFETLGVALACGRAFTDADYANAQPVAIVNQAMAARYWRGKDPIGRKFHLESRPAQSMEVVGVAGDFRMTSITGAEEPYFFRPLAQDYISYETLEIRTAGPPAATIPEARSAIESLAPGLPVFDVAPMSEALGGSAFLLFRIGAALAAGLGLLGLALALVGVYGVTAYAASQRTHEIGIRLALGARPVAVLKTVFAQSAAIIGAGLTVGMLGALGAARVVGSYLIVSATNPATYLAVAAALALVTLAACYIPARRAMRIAPTEALRHE